jgi:hypothetical protein
MNIKSTDYVPKRWQEIDASDASFMTPKRLNAIRILLRQPQISLHCLNAPHAATNGVVPLSMAAWLNFPNLVELLLEESADTVAVDGLDAHGATALMCTYLNLSGYQISFPKVRGVGTLNGYPITSNFLV